MIKESLFAAEERETKLNKLGDVLQILEEHVDFAALAAAIDAAAPPAESRARRASAVSDRNHGSYVVIAATL